MRFCTSVCCCDELDTRHLETPDTRKLQARYCCEGGISTSRPVDRTADQPSRSARQHSSQNTYVIKRVLEGDAPCIPICKPFCRLYGKGTKFGWRLSSRGSPGKHWLKDGTDSKRELENSAAEDLPSLTSAEPRRTVLHPELCLHHRHHLSRSLGSHYSPSRAASNSQMDRLRSTTQRRLVQNSA